MFVKSLAVLALSFLQLSTARSSSWQPWQNSNDGPDYILVATAENVTIDCESRYSVLFNGTTPGPTLYLKEGATTWVRVYNNIADQNLTCHWHGLAMDTSVFSDGTPQVSQYPIAPYNYFDYFMTPEIGHAGSYFYHSHVDLQIITATGVLIVEDVDSPPYDYDDDLSVFIQDFYAKNDSTIMEGLTGSPFKWPGEPDAIVINGKSGNQSFTNATDDSCKPEVISIKPGSTSRLRFISNTVLSFVVLGIEDHDNLTIIEADGEYTEPWSTDRIQIGSGQRFSILLQGKNEEELQVLGKTNFWIRYESRDRPKNVTGYALLQYQTSSGTSALPSNLPQSPPVVLPADTKNITTWAEYSLSSLNKSTAEAFPKLSEVTRTVYITMQQVGPYNGSFLGTLKWDQNDLTWTADSSAANHTVPYLIQVYETQTVPNYTAALANDGWDPNDQRHAFPALVGEVLDIVWLSNSGPTGGWDVHPWHSHGSHYWDLGSGNGTYNATENEKYFDNYTPAKRDTTMVYRYAVSGVPETTAGWRAWRIRITEEAVVWVYGSLEQILARFPTVPYIDGFLEYGGDATGNSSYDPFVDGMYAHTH